MPDADAQALKEANRLYWETGLSVARIADRMAWSRRALYDAVEPLPAGRNCPDCGEPAVFVNRSARDAGAAECPRCGREVAVAAAGDLAGARQAGAGAGDAAARAAGPEQVARHRTAREPDTDAAAASADGRAGRIVLAGILMGLGVGVIATVWRRSR